MCSSLYKLFMLILYHRERFSTSVTTENLRFGRNCLYAIYTHLRNFFMRKSITQKDFFMTEKGKKIEVSSKAIVGFHTYSTLEHGIIFFVAEIYWEFSHPLHVQRQPMQKAYDIQWKRFHSSDKRRSVPPPYENCLHSLHDWLQINVVGSLASPRFDVAYKHSSPLSFRISEGGQSRVERKSITSLTTMVVKKKSKHGNGEKRKIPNILSNPISSSSPRSDTLWTLEKHFRIREKKSDDWLASVAHKFCMLGEKISPQRQQRVWGLIGVCGMAAANWNCLKIENLR